MGAQETIIYRLVMRNLSHDAYFSFSLFWATFGGKWAWPLRAPPMVWGIQTDQKVGPLDGPFGSTTISKSCSRIF